MFILISIVVGIYVLFTIAVGRFLHLASVDESGRISA